MRELFLRVEEAMNRGDTTSARWLLYHIGLLQQAMTTQPQQKENE